MWSCKLFFSFAVKEVKLTNYFYYDVIDCHLTLTHKSFRDVLLKSPIPSVCFRCVHSACILAHTNENVILL